VTAQIAAVKITANFEANLAAIQAFWAADDVDDATLTNTWKATI